MRGEQSRPLAGPAGEASPRSLVPVFPGRFGTPAPAPVSSFVGRRAERELLAKLVASNRLVTVTGPGGIGKTRLVLELAREAAFDQLGGMAWVDLTGASDAVDVDVALLAALELTGRPGIAPGDVVADAARGRRGVLVIDNCEQVAPVVGERAQQILHRCSDVRIVTTSRSSLEVPGETVWLLPPLSLEVHTGGRSEAASLFLARARAAGAEQAVAPQQIAIVSAICRELEGLPLAIELAAAQTRMCSLHEIRDRLADRLDLLTGGPRLAPARQRAIRASIDWSYELIEPPARTLLRRLSVFLGGWDVEAMRAVCADGERAAAELARPLEQLVVNSIVTADPRGAVTRFTVSEPIRQYAAERLESAGERAQLRDRHLMYFRGLAARADGELWVLDPQRRGVLDREAANLTAALEHACAAHPDAALDLVGHLAPYWANTGKPELGARAAAQALEVARDGPPGPLALAYAMGAWLTLYAGDVARAGQLLSAAEHVLAEAAAPRARAWVDGLRAMMTSVVDPSGGQPLLERASALAREAGDKLLVSHLLVTLVIAHDVCDDREAVERTACAASAVANEIGHHLPMQWISWAVARQALLAGEVDSCLAHLHAAQHLHGEPEIEVRWSSAALAAIAHAHGGAVDAARECADQAAALVGGRARWIGAGNVVHARGVVALACGEADAARRCAEQLVAWQGGGVHLGVHGHELLLMTTLATGDAGGIGEHAEALALAAERFGNRRAAALARYGAGVKALVEHDPARALALAVEAMEQQLAGGWRPAAIDSLELLAAAERARGRSERSAVLGGAAHAARAALGLARLSPPHTALSETALAEPPAQAWASGQRLTLAEALDYSRRARGGRSRPKHGLASLTLAERAVADLAAAGLSTPAIAERLVVSRHTVKTHLAHIYAKLGVANRIELAAKIAQLGDVPPPPTP